MGSASGGSLGQRLLPKVTNSAILQHEKKALSRLFYKLVVAACGV
jgi:hypothetical protein